ncbi:MAG: phenylalanine--tRNA ligase subunit beta [Actinobacteria bacterium]|nr:phenylalanine--tRNA ligase subunit beta [Actinomycetota bacterium]
MKVLLSWLREFAPIEGDPVWLGEQMSDLGMAVEEMTELGKGLDGIVVAKVLDLKPHPNADKIQLVDVDLGDGEPLQICCGAFNMAVGDVVPLATLGTTMPNGMAIERRKLRGEWSNGMLCSAAEIGLGDDHAGIMILGDNLALGTDFKTALGIVDDVLYDLEINPNRPDAMSVAGVARDLAARLKVPFALPEPQVAAVGDDAKGRASVAIVDPDLCGRFLARVLDGVHVGPSPHWLANRLTALGMRPINNVVDVSNYVMLELGQPNHTYDLAEVPDGELRVRWAQDGETIVTLDGIERALRPTDGVIANRDDEAIGIAGVMGGASTEISGATTSVLLEMAWWDPMAISVSSKRLGLRSEASSRFEKGADPEVVELAALRFAELLWQSADSATLAPGLVDQRGQVWDRSPIALRTQRVSEVIGIPVGDDEIRALLEPIGFEFDEQDGPGVQEVVVPSWRYDTRAEIDVIEEIARHHGYSNIPGRLPPAVHTGSLTPRQLDRRLLRDVMVGLGFDEAMPMPFLAPGDLERAHVTSDAVHIVNPLVAEESVLRTSLRPGLLKAIAFNESHRNEHVRLFETGRVFLRPPEGQRLPGEPEHLGAVLAGEDAIAAVEAWSVLANSLHVDGWRLDQRVLPGLHATRSARILVGEHEVGLVGEIDPEVLAAYHVNERTGWVELDLDALLAEPHGETHLHGVSRYPSSDIDLAFAVDDQVPASEVRAAIEASAGGLLVGLDLFDVYRGEGVADGRRSLAFTLRLQAGDHTLTDGEVADLRQRVIDAVQASLPATLRG